jgi:hypothetical protein
MKPAAWVRNLTDPQPHCVTDLKYMSAADVDAGVQYVPLYTKREWQGLTPEEAREISLANRPYVVDMIAALEARLKEKNT